MESLSATVDGATSTKLLGLLVRYPLESIKTDFIPDIGLEESNDFNSVRVVLKRLNEESVGKTSLVLKFITLSLDLSESSISPLEPIVGFTDLSFNLSSVSLSIEPILFVNVDNLGELRNDSSTSIYNQ